MCYSGFITIDRTNPSESGLYVVDLPGVTVAQLDGLTKDEQADDAALFENIYRVAQINLKIDLQKKLAQRFHIDKKLVSRETSDYLADANSGADLAGVKISFNLPKYARVNILSIGVRSNVAYASPTGTFFIYDTDADGELLATVTSDIVTGRNTVKVYQEFEHDDLFIAYNPDDFSFDKTENKYYSDSSYSKDHLSCMYPCAYGGEGSVTQVNGGGLNVKFVIYCSMEKFICENLPLFQFALWYRIGVDLMKERIVSDRVTRFTVLAEDRAKELLEVFNEEYQNALEAATMNIKMQEDPVCFLCKRTISVVTSLP